MEQFINLDESYFFEAAELFSSSFAGKRSGQMKFQRAEKADLEEVFRLYKSAIAKMDLPGLTLLRYSQALRTGERDVLSLEKRNCNHDTKRN